MDRAESGAAARIQAQSLLAEIAGSIVISTQVLSEFYVTATRKLAKLRLQRYRVRSAKVITYPSGSSIANSRMP